MYGLIRNLVFGMFVSFFVFDVDAQTLADSAWRVTMDTSRFGPVETVLQFHEHDGKLIAESLSGALEIIQPLPNARRCFRFR